MSRIDVRCNVNLPVSVVYGNGSQEAMGKNARFSVLSLNGAYIDYKHHLPDRKVVGLKYELPKHGEFEMLGEVMRKEKKGIAVKFHNVNRDTRIKLWDYIKENITEEETTCPYCGGKNARKVRECGVCGWNLNFNSPDYLVQHEKEAFINRITAKSKAFTIEDIYKTLNFIDVEVLGIGKSWEINEEFVGSCRAMLDVFSMIRKVAPTDLPVLITGESGTGKELTARAIHERSSRREGPFVPINCAAIPDNLLETELFGYEEGAFHGVDISRISKLEYADGGTIFLAEISALSPNLQSKLLRFLEDKIIQRIGGKDGKKVEVRLVAAVNKNLKAAVTDGTFRKDLFYKLDAFNIKLPPVRERGDDKIILARYFLNKFFREMNISKTFTKEALDSIKNYDWLGNVREIINKVRRAVVMSSDTDVTTADLDLNIQTINIEAIPSLRDVRSTIERQKLIEVLNICNNNISKTAKVLGISRPSVYSMKKKFEI
jgi:transcriptional regulator with PAS, ATPase and Fis domain